VIEFGSMAERLKDKAERILLAYELEYNVPHFVPIRAGQEFRTSGSLVPETFSKLEDMRRNFERFTVRTYRPLQTIGNEPLFLDVTFEEALLLAYFALDGYSISALDSIPSERKQTFSNVRSRADATAEARGYSFGREFYKLLSRNRDGVTLNVLFQEYIDRDHAERSGRIAFFTDSTGVYSHRIPEAGRGPIVRDVDYAEQTVISGVFSRLDQIEDEIIRTKVAKPLQTLTQLFPWKQGVVVEFDYHAVPVGRRRERLIVYDFHEAEVTVRDITGGQSISPSGNLLVVSRIRGPIDPKEVAEQILAELGNRRGVYVSGPITTGLEFYQLLRRLGIEDVTVLKSDEHAALRKELDALVQRNISRMSQVADRLRSRYGSLVIDPGKIAISDWSQDHYMSLWSRVIRTGVEKIYFLDGWEYSNGGVAEYCLGTELGLQLLDESGESLSKDRALRLLNAAVTSLRKMGFVAPNLDEAIRQLGPERRPQTQPRPS